MFRRILVVSFVLSIALGSEKVYEGFKVYEIKVKSQEDLNFLENLDNIEGEERSLDFLSFHNNVGDTVRLMVEPLEQRYIEKLFKVKKIDYKVTVNNVQE
jgi:Carboxypeptidase activation peptide